MNESQQPPRFVEVFTTDNPIEAELLRNMLQSEDIVCEATGLNQGGLTGLGIMEIKLLVPDDVEQRARKLILELEKE